METWGYVTIWGAKNVLILSGSPHLIEECVAHGIIYYIACQFTMLLRDKSYITAITKQFIDSLLQNLNSISCVVMLFTRGVEKLSRLPDI